MRLPTPPCHLQALDNISAFSTVSNFLQWGLIQVRPASLLPAETVRPSQSALPARTVMHCLAPRLLILNEWHLTPFRVQPLHASIAAA